MKTEFKVGDVVKIYGTVQMYPNKVEFLRGQKATIIESPYGPGEYRASYVADSFVIVHAKQCRRIVKKKREEIWVNEFKNGFEAFQTKEQAEANFGRERISCTRYIKARRQG